MNPDKQIRPDDAATMMLRDLNGALGEQETAMLNMHLKNNRSSRKAAAFLLLQELHLAEIAQAAEESTPVSAESSAAQRIIRWTDRALHRLLDVFRPRIAWVGGAVLMAAVLAVLASGLWNVRFFSGGLRIVEVRGVVILDRDHRQWPVSGEIELQGGDELSFQSGASASIRFQRGATTLRFSRSAQLRLESVRNGKAIRLNRGLLVGVVSRQPRNAPIRVLTPHAEAQVLGTEFTLFADNQKTRLEVWDGKVHLRRTSDDASTTVSKGQFAVAANGVPLVNRPLSRGVLWEYWLGLNGQSVGDLTADPRSPDQPTGKDYLPAFEAPTNWADHYGARAHAWLRPPATGAYTFWIAADDAAELWLSPDENSENKVRICWTENWTRPREWDKHPEQKSSPIVLKADRLYYIEARHREAGGGDCLAVAWKAPDREREIIPADQLNLPDETQDLARLESGLRKALSPR